MPKTKIKLLSRQILYGIIAVVMIFAYFPNIASASPITPRKVMIGSSVASAVTSYNFTFTLPSPTVVQSLGFQACDTASGACTQTGAALGFSSSVTPASLNGTPTGLGSGGTWTIDTTVASALRIKNASNTGAPSAVTVNFNNVKNPSATNSTFFIRITSYSDSAWTTPIDTGTVATSTAGQVTVTVGIDEVLAFTLATASVTLTTPTLVTTGTGTSSMTVSTNANSGYSVSYSGATLASGANSLTAMSAGGASAAGTKQFGINMMANATPSVGTGVTGPGTGTAQAGYNSANSFKFNPAGDTIAAATTQTNTNTFTTSYIANMDTSTQAGQYSTAITYTATGNF
ncbi:MAG TPA: hypothetical protein VMR16_03865 [Candidatus Saccharimonadales bacterium]|nr:hypothetical protein [Candidatus Saccharimonadales bacterium]